MSCTYRDPMAGLRGMLPDDAKALITECLQQAGVDIDAGENAATAWNVCYRIANAAHKAGAQAMHTRMAAPTPGEAPAFVVVSSTDGCKPEDDTGEPRGPLVWETYTEKATLQEAMKRAAQLERKHGACRIARLVYD